SRATFVHGWVASADGDLHAPALGRTRALDVRESDAPAEDRARRRRARRLLHTGSHRLQPADPRNELLRQGGKRDRRARPVGERRPTRESTAFDGYAHART